MMQQHAPQQGMPMPSQNVGQGMPQQATRPIPGIQKPAAPRSNVQENDIQIPSFLTRKK